MQTLLFKLGLVLFVIGLLTGFAIPALKNPRMGLTSHLEGVLNGMFLALLGLLWPHVHLPHVWDVAGGGVGRRSQIGADRCGRPRGLESQRERLRFPGGVTV